MNSAEVPSTIPRTKALKRIERHEVILCGGGNSFWCVVETYSRSCRRNGKTDRGAVLSFAE